MKKQIELLKATESTNGIIVRKTANNLNSVEIRKVSLSGRNNGYVASVSSKGNVTLTGGSWRGQQANAPEPYNSLEALQELVNPKINEILKLI